MVSENGLGTEPGAPVAAEHSSKWIRKSALSTTLLHSSHCRDFARFIMALNGLRSPILASNWLQRSSTLSRARDRYLLVSTTLSLLGSPVNFISNAPLMVSCTTL